MENENLTNQPSAAPRPGVSETASLPPPRRRVGPGFYIFLVMVLAASGVGWWYYARFVAPFETTDDAFIESYVTFISPRVAGPVVKLLVADNQRVKAGDMLLQIDPRDYQLALDQTTADVGTAESQVMQAEAKITVDQAKAEEETAAIASAQAAADRAQADRGRYESVQSQAVSKSQLDLAKTQANATAAEVEVARNKAKAALAQVELDRADAQTARAQVKQARARLEQAQLQLSYTTVYAPRAGRVTRRTVEEGAYVQTGQALLALVPDDVWVVANFKETQLGRVRPGQAVVIRVDACPQREFQGKVDSVQAGAGARFSLLPPENAVGNYVKVVQRVPVKIIFDDPVDLTQFNLAPGMSVQPRVRVK